MEEQEEAGGGAGLPVVRYSYIHTYFIHIADLSGGLGYICLPSAFPPPGPLQSLHNVGRKCGCRNRRVEAAKDGDGEGEENV